MNRWLTRLFLAITIAALLGLLPYRAYGPKGLGHIHRLERELATITERNAHLSAENESFRRTIARLKEDHRAIEKVARDEFGLVRPEDIVFQFE